MKHSDTDINTTSVPQVTTPAKAALMVWVQPTSRITDNVLCDTSSLNISDQALYDAIELRSQVIFQYDKSTDSGRIVGVHTPQSPPSQSEKLSPVLRLANHDDFAAIHRNEQDRAVAKLIFSRLIHDHNMPEMRPISARYTFDRTKIIFSFTTKGRVDFRTLAKELSKVFRSRIEIRQIPPDYEIRQFGSTGICGRSPCCNIHPHILSNHASSARNLRGSRTGPCGKTLCCEKW